MNPDHKKYFQPDPRFEVSPQEHWWLAGALLACLLLAVIGWMLDRDARSERQQRMHDALIAQARLHRMVCRRYTANRITERGVLVEACVRTVAR